MVDKEGEKNFINKLEIKRFFDKLEIKNKVVLYIVLLLGGILGF